MNASRTRFRNAFFLLAVFLFSVSVLAAPRLVIEGVKYPSQVLVGLPNPAFDFNIKNVGSSAGDASARLSCTPQGGGTTWQSPASPTISGLAVAAKSQRSIPVVTGSGALLAGPIYICTLSIATGIPYVPANAVDSRIMYVNVIAPQTQSIPEFPPLAGIAVGVLLVAYLASARRE
jgi:hypothetical protein